MKIERDEIISYFFEDNRLNLFPLAEAISFCASDKYDEGTCGIDCTIEIISDNFGRRTGIKGQPQAIALAINNLMAVSDMLLRELCRETGALRYLEVNAVKRDECPKPRMDNFPSSMKWDAKAVILGDSDETPSDVFFRPSND